MVEWGGMQDTPFLLGFTAGELSPWLSCRFDLQAYQRGAALIRNFMVQPYGGLCRRQGTQYVAQAASAGEGERLFSFRFSHDDMLLLEFYPGGIRFYKDGACVQKNGAPYVVPTSWRTAAQVQSLQLVQLNDIVFITCPSTAPALLQRFSDTSWTLRPMQLDPFPRETHVRQDSPLSVHMLTAMTAELEAQKDVFSAAMPNREEVLVDAEIPARTLFLNTNLQIPATSTPNFATDTVAPGTVVSERNNTTSFYEYYTCIRAYTPDAFCGRTSAADYPCHFVPGVMLLSGSGPIEVCGDWELRTTGEWDASFELWRSYDTKSYNSDFRQWRWTCIKSFSQDSFSTRKNWEVTGSEKIPCRLVLVCRASKTATIGSILHMVIHASKREYRFTIVAYETPRKVLATPVSEYAEATPDFVSSDWSFGAFGSRNGFPRMVGFYQNRLWLGGIAGLPTTLLASCMGDFYNFRVDSDDDSALHLTLSTSDQSRICWICPARSLLVGTTESEWILSSPDGGAVRATTAGFSRQSSVGSEERPASGVENTVFYVQRGGKRLREISYKLEADGFTSTDISLLAEHLFTPGIKEWAVQRGGNTRLWVLMQDGSLAVLTTNPAQQINAWQRVDFPGREVLHLTAHPQAGNNEDEVWFVLRNTVSGICSLERITSTSGYLDGATHGTEPCAPHLAGLPGMVHPLGRPELATPVVFGGNGEFEVPEAEEGTEWCYGAVFDSELQTLPMERDFSFNTIRQEGRVRLRLLESDPAFQYRASHATRWEEYDPARDHLPATYTGSIRISHIPSPGVGQGFCLRVNGDKDFRLLALTVEIDYHGR